MAQISIEQAENKMFDLLNKDNMEAIKSNNNPRA